MTSLTPSDPDQMARLRTAELSEHASPAERGSLLGCADMLSGLAAALTVAGGVTLARLGLVAVTVPSAVLALAAAVWILLRGDLSRTGSVT